MSKAEFAELDENGIVLREIVIERAMLDTGRWGDPSRWVQSADKDGKSCRKNKPGKGDSYDESRDAFIAPKPSMDAVLDERTCQWIVLEPIVGNISA